MDCSIFCLLFSLLLMCHGLLYLREVGFACRVRGTLRLGTHVHMVPAEPCRAPKPRPTSLRSAAFPSVLSNHLLRQDVMMPFVWFHMPHMCLTCSMHVMCMTAMAVYWTACCVVSCVQAARAHSRVLSSLQSLQHALLSSHVGKGKENEKEKPCCSMVEAPESH